MCPSSSSTTRIVTSCTGTMPLPLPRRIRQRHVEHRAPPLLALRPDPAMVPLDRPLDDGEAHAIPGSDGGMEALEALEEPALRRRGDAEPVVAHPDVDLPGLGRAADLDLSGPRRIQVGDCVGDQV